MNFDQRRDGGPPARGVAERPVPEPEIPQYTGRARHVAAIVAGNFALNLVTLGFYRFWGKTRLRRYLWSRVAAYGDAPEYTGLGREMFIGFLVAMAILIPIFGGFGALDYYYTGRNETVRQLVGVAQTVMLIYLIQVAIFRARRYRMSRTAWRGIRFGMTGTGSRYAGITFAYGLLAAATLWIAAPLLSVRMQNYIVANSWLGDRRFAFAARARDLIGRWLICLLLMLPTLGLSMLWYKAFELRYLTRCTTFENLRFRLLVTGRDLAAIYLPYFAGLAAAFAVMFVHLQGLSTPEQLARNPNLLANAGLDTIVLAIALLLAIRLLGVLLLTHRLIGLFSRRLRIAGRQDFAAIAQSSRAVPGRGEGLADALDVGGI